MDQASGPLRQRRSVSLESTTASAFELRPMSASPWQDVPVHVRRDARSGRVGSDVEAVSIVDSDMPRRLLHCREH